jgi:hypothetical protein
MPIVAISVTEAEKAYLSKAAGETPLARYVRNSAIDHASMVLGAPPVREPHTRSGSVAEFASQAGLTVNQFRSYATMVAMGADPGEALAKVQSRKPREAKAAE